MKQKQSRSINLQSKSELREVYQEFQPSYDMDL